MKELKNHTSPKWWIARTGTNIIHYGRAKKGQVVTTGQATLEQFNNEHDWKNKLKALGITVNAPSSFLPGPI
jgi:hypothetical protein